MRHICLCTPLLTWLHGTRYDILLRVCLCLFLGNLAYPHKVIDKRMVLSAEHNPCRFLTISQAQLIHSAVADMRHGYALRMETEKRHGGTHLTGFAIVLGIQSIIGLVKSLL